MTERYAGLVSIAASAGQYVVVVGGCYVGHFARRQDANRFAAIALLSAP